MIFERKLSITADRLERRLADLLDTESRSAAAPRLAEAMRYAVLGGGKRLRPFLLLESAALFGEPAQGALDAAAALECLHCYSLAHDDLPAMDDDEVRRGKPTVHVAFDEATAILAGDALLTLAFEIMARTATHPDPPVRAELTLGMARAAGWRGMAAGQSLDLESEGKQLAEAAIEAIQALKTGALITFACEAGAIISNAEASDRQALVAYGKDLGAAFQLADDLLDVEGRPAEVGKATGKDAAAGKATLISTLGVPAARVRLAQLEDAAVRHLSRFGNAAETLIETARFVTRRSY